MHVIAPATLPAAPEIPAVHRNRFSVSRTAGSMPVWSPKTEDLHADFAENPNPVKVETGEKLGFKDVLDIVNPLQHIPLIDNLYRRVTGDEISAPAQFIGGMLYGGPVGAVAAMTDIAVREQTGKGIGDRVASMLGAKSADAPAPVLRLAARKAESPRMAGTIPVWGAQPVTPTVLPGGGMAPETNFALMLNSLASGKPA